MKLPLTRFTVSGNSMAPTLTEGQDVLSLNWFYKPKVGDMIVINKNGKDMIKRVTKIHGREILVEGDNKLESSDVGPVKNEQIIGKVIYQSDKIPCPSCESPVIGIYGRKDAICNNCGFKLTCCGEP